MIVPERYSLAPRCGPCGQRAVLSRRTAERLAEASRSSLVVFPCPNHDDGWHVCAPDTEFFGYLGTHQHEEPGSGAERNGLPGYRGEGDADPEGPAPVRDTGRQQDDATVIANPAGVVGDTSDSSDGPHGNDGTGTTGAGPDRADPDPGPTELAGAAPESAELTGADPGPADAADADPGPPDAAGANLERADPGTGNRQEDGK